MGFTVYGSFFVPFGQADPTHLLCYHSLEVKNDICSSDALTMGALDS